MSRFAAVRVGLAVLLVACLACVSLVFCGCRNSDALKEVVYDQSSDVIDYDNPTKVYINDSTSDIESEDVSAAETSENATRYSDTVQNLVVYSSDPNTVGFTAKKSLFDPKPDFTGIEASEEVCFVRTDDPDAYDHPPTIEDTDEPEQQEQSVEQTVSPNAQTDQVSNRGAAGTAGESGGDEGDAGEGEGDDSPEGDDNPEPKESDDGGNQDEPRDDDVDVGYDSSDPTQDPEQVDSYAAYGAAAALVEMVGGKGALAATDAVTLDSRFSSAFDVSGVVQAWSGDGSSASQLDVDKIIESGADSILVYAGDYLKSGLSSADMKKLNAAGVTQTVLYPMSNSGYIKQDVTVVGAGLANSKKAQYAGQTAQRAADYRAFHDEVVKAAADANKGLAGAKLLQGGADSVADFSSSYAYTVLVDEYDDTASYQGSAKGDWSPVGGLAFASAGYDSTPVSYYMQAGGLVNTAADYMTPTDSGPVVVWQFLPSLFAFKASQWKGNETTRAAVSPPQEGDGFQAATLSTPVNLHGMLGVGDSFGSKAFPKIVATSKLIKDQLIANSKNANGVYHPYDMKNMGMFNMTGPNAYALSCIGYSSEVDEKSKNLFDGKIPDSAVVIQPTGLFSDWTQGTVESFLEAAWVSDVANGTGATVGWKSYVDDFYNRFYGHNLTDAEWAYMNPEGD